MIDLEKSLYDWFVEDACFKAWESPYAVTLPLKRRGFQSPCLLNDWCAREDLANFLECLNDEFFSGDDLRKGSRVRCIPIRERGDHSYYRLCLDKPTHVPEASFFKLVVDCWYAQDYAHWDVDIKPADADWIRSMAKLQANTQVPDALDWENYWNPR
jgi:hypothetical protein